MGKPKRIPQKKQNLATGSDDEDLYRDLEKPDPNSSDYIHNEIDEFNNNREKILLDSESEDENIFGGLKEEVFPLSDGSDEDDNVNENDYYSRMAQKDDIASDLEDNEDDYLPNDQAWGKRKSSYYSTDYVDPDYGGFQGDDAEMAEAEEKEALNIQKRLLQQLNEDDFGLDWISPPTKGTVDVGPAESEGQKISQDFSKLGDKEKLELLQGESPELLCLVDEFNQRMTELINKILPLLELVDDGRIPDGPGADYLRIKKQLIYAYCTNIAFYMTIRSKTVNVRNHPVMKRLMTFRKLLEQLRPLEVQLESEIQTLLERLKEGKDIDPNIPWNNTKGKSIRKSKSKSRAQGKTKYKKKSVQFEIPQKTSSKRKMADTIPLETADEKEALAMYDLMKSKMKKKKESSSSDELSENDEEEDAASGLQEEEDDSEVVLEKRGITYQIAKNKGLTPHRKKENRNPRVRHRVKFQKAKIRRKGQFKEPRTEVNRYGGEVSGIRIGTKRGIKLK